MPATETTALGILATVVAGGAAALGRMWYELRRLTRAEARCQKQLAAVRADQRRLRDQLWHTHEATQCNQEAMMAALKRIEEGIGQWPFRPPDDTGPAPGPAA
jgi:uncharacterized membrane protein YcjF (UPF0283 family)